MVTKAELEAEVAELRRQLAEHANPEPPKAPEPADAFVDNLGHWTAQIDEVLTEFEDLPHKKPILFALGVFALGYMIGRSR
ncbi:hypothetical protein [Ruegeria lacuscaerulensis]|uniref:hypothetical protein n=1 Tax=Ruegeria lacuscaerulensis TaxID=55218 RepID=UPI00147B6AA5|nr:hypothetical protein [Ruegeria lacuscaerulensis]